MVRVSLPFAHSFSRQFAPYFTSFSFSPIVSSPIVCARVGDAMRRIMARPLHHNARRVRACKTSAMQAMQGFHAGLTGNLQADCTRYVQHQPIVRRRGPRRTLPQFAPDIPLPLFRGARNDEGSAHMATVNVWRCKLQTAVRFGLRSRRNAMTRSLVALGFNGQYYASTSHLFCNSHFYGQQIHLFVSQGLRLSRPGGFRMQRQDAYLASYFCRARSLRISSASPPSRWSLQELDEIRFEAM